MADKVQVAGPTSENGCISSWSESPLRHMVRLAVLFCQKLFQAAPRGYYHWEEDDQETEVIFTREVPVDQETIHKRPVVAIVRSTAGWQGLGMDQLQSENAKTGQRTHVDMISGYLTFNCLAREGDESEQIAWLIANHMWLLRRVLLKLGFHDIGQRFQIGGQGPPGQLVQGSSKSEIINVPAITSFQFSVSSTIVEEGSPIVAELEANIVASLPEAYRPTPARSSLSGTGLVLGSGLPVEYPNILASLRPPTVNGRRAEVTQVIGSNLPAEPVGVKVLIDSDEG